jgi:hypothetical protein
VATIQLHLFLGFFADLAVSVCLCIVVAVRKTFAPVDVIGAPLAPREHCSSSQSTLWCFSQHVPHSLSLPSSLSASLSVSLPSPSDTRKSGSAASRAASNRRSVSRSSTFCFLARVAASVRFRALDTPIGEPARNPRKQTMAALRGACVGMCVCVCVCVCVRGVASSRGRFSTAIYYWPVVNVWGSPRVNTMVTLVNV